MTWPRVVARNSLGGDYQNNPVPGLHDDRWPIRGDLRRLEADQRDDLHLAGYAQTAGVTVEQARAVLDAFFAGTAADGLSDEHYDALYEKLPHVIEIRAMETRMADKGARS